MAWHCSQPWRIQTEDGARLGGIGSLRWQQRRWKQGRKQGGWMRATKTSQTLARHHTDKAEAETASAPAAEARCGRMVFGCVRFFGACSKLFCLARVLLCIYILYCFLFIGLFIYWFLFGYFYLYLYYMLFIFIFLFIFIYVCKYVCMHACMYVCACVCASTCFLWIAHSLGTGFKEISWSQLVWSLAWTETKRSDFHWLSTRCCTRVPICITDLLGVVSQRKSLKKNARREVGNGSRSFSESFLKSPELQKQHAWYIISNSAELRITSGTQQTGPK